MAKSWDPADGPTPSSVFLPNHLNDVVACAEAIVDATGAAQLRALGVDPSNSLSRFRKLAVLAAACHDLGKANNQFQRLVVNFRGTSAGRQAVRHEWVSWYILQQEALKGWLYKKLDEPTCDVDWQILLWSITGHHPAFGRTIPSSSPDCSTDAIELALGHQDFIVSLQGIAKSLGCSDCPVRMENRTISAESDIYRMIRTSLADALSNWEHWGSEQETRGILAATKNTLVAADIAGSALPTSTLGRHSHVDWQRAINASLSVAPTPEELSRLIDDRLTNNGRKSSLRQFQVDVAKKASEVTLVKAGCGSGKTLAAYNWARECCSGKRVYVCYPTTGTATEGFRDYLFDESEHQPKSGAELFHSRSAIDNRIILEASREDSDAKDLDSTFSVLDRIRSLKSWGVPIVSCTVDTVLGIMHNHRRAIYSWPALCNAAFVFDEIHSYDSTMFGALLAFLKNLPGVPVLLMTASLPENRLKEVRNSVGNRADRLVEISGPLELESLKRYRQWKQPDRQIVDIVSEELKANGKVLWVSNTVKRTMDAYRACSQVVSSETVYHSRFRYIDRVKRHRAVISQFGIEGTAAIAWTSQVAEMSLDLSATLLITDLAPIPALIQRLGRLNRKAKPPNASIMPFIVIEPIDNEGGLQSLPYNQQQLEEALDWLNKLPAEITQRDLVQIWEGMGFKTKEEIPKDSKWIDGGYEREVKEVRSGSPSVNVILRSDVDRVRSGELSLPEVIIPMNQKTGMKIDEWPQFQGATIVNESILQYSELLGGEWI